MPAHGKHAKTRVLYEDRQRNARSARCATNESARSVAISHHGAFAIAAATANINTAPEARLPRAARGAMPMPRVCQSQTRTIASTTTSPAINLGSVPLSIAAAMTSISRGSGRFGDAEQVGEILEEHPQVSHRTLTHKLLMHVRLPGEALHVGVSTHFHEPLAALVVDVPKTL